MENIMSKLTTATIAISIGFLSIAGAAHAQVPAGLLRLDTPSQSTTLADANDVRVQKARNAYARVGKPHQHQ
jgi:hypothetical protein